ncbi:MAG: DUF1801 domain-containing protein [Candidatus Doudnabacteria bacterium]|nr:DUF1801 domain-containing protein [Candidatus Doudnabacteria bacterium]
MKKTNPVDDYIKKFPKEIQVKLQKVRSIIKKTAPSAEESLSYGMPGYKLYGFPLVYFGAWNNHLGFYPVPSGIKAFIKELEPYKKAKGSVRFTYDKIPYGLLVKMVKFRMKENKAKAKL